MTASVCLSVRQSVFDITRERKGSLTLAERKPITKGVTREAI